MGSAFIYACFVRAFDVCFEALRLLLDYNERLGKIEEV